MVGQASLLLLDETGTLLTTYDLASNPITLSCSVGQLTPNLINDPSLFAGGVVNLAGLQVSYRGPSGATAITASSTGVSSTAVLVSFSGYDILDVPGLSADTVSHLYSNIATDISVTVVNGGDLVAIQDPTVKAFFHSGGGSTSVFFDAQSNGRQTTVRVELPTSGLSLGSDTLLLVLESVYQPNGQAVNAGDTLRIPIVVLGGEGLHIAAGTLEPNSAYAGIPFNVSFLVSTGGIQQPWDSASFRLAMVSATDSVLSTVYSGPVVYTDIRQDTLVYGGVTVQVPPVFPPGAYRTLSDYALMAGGLRFRSHLPYRDTLNVLPAPSLTYQTGTLAPTTVIAGQEWSFHFEVLLDGDAPVSVASADSYFELKLGDFSAAVGFQLTGNTLYPGLNTISTRRLFIPPDLVGQLPEAAAVLSYFHPGSANRLSFSTDFQGRTIFVEAAPEIQIINATVIAPNAPSVNTGQSFRVHCQVADMSATAIGAFDLKLTTDGQSHFDSLATVPGISGHDTSDVYFDVIAASNPNPAEILSVDIATPNIIRLNPVNNIAKVTIQSPAELSTSLILRGADSGFVEVGGGFDLLLTLVNAGESKATPGVFHISTNGMDLGLPGGVTELDQSVAVGDVHAISFTAPSYDTVIVLDIVLSQKPIDENTALPAIVGDTAFHIEIAVTTPEINLHVVTSDVPSNVLLPDALCDLVVFRVSNPSLSSVSDIKMLSMSLTLLDRDARPLTVSDVLKVDSTTLQVEGRVVARASSTANRLILTFNDFVVPSRDTLDLVLNTTTAGATAPEFTLSLETSGIVAAYASGPRQGTAVAVTSDSSTGLVVDEVFTMVDRTLAGSFVVRTNPFDPLTEPAEFRYFLAKAEDVTFVVLTLTGETVYSRTLSAGETGAEAGENVLFWDGRNDDEDVVVNGVYLAIISLADDRDRATIKLAVIK